MVGSDVGVSLSEHHQKGFILKRMRGGGRLQSKQSGVVPAPPGSFVPLDCSAHPVEPEKHVARLSLTFAVVTVSQRLQGKSKSQ